MGVGGGQRFDDFLCVLAPNIISEKIFVFLWFWYLLLAVVAVFNVVFVGLMAAPNATIRKWLMVRVVFSKRVSVRGHFTEINSMRELQP